MKEFKATARDHLRARHARREFWRAKRAQGLSVLDAWRLATSYGAVEWKCWRYMLAQPR